MDNYTQYLLKNAYSKTTVTHYRKRLLLFTKWLKKQHLQIDQIDYKACLRYIKHLKRKGIQAPTVNNHIVTIRNYFNYRITKGERSDNPLEDVAVKGGVKRMLHNLLESDELEDLYYSYQTQNFSKKANKNAKLIAKRNKVITGLLAYQGLNTTNLKSLLLEHLELHKGKIYIPSTKRSNPRKLELKPWQVLDLLHYVNEIRPQIAKKNDIANDRLLIPQTHFNDLIHIGVLKRLKKINHKAINVHHLRASVIVNWLKQYNIRKVQYLAGHKHISSTEAYKQNNLENLQEAINTFHPIH